MRTFTITYQIQVGNNEEVDKKIENICLEQSVELPYHVLNQHIADTIVGKLTEQRQIDDDIYLVKISWPFENIGGEISNFLNILYGNISLQPGIKIIDAQWSVLAPELFKGPALGIEKIRKQTGIHDRAFSATALKPVGKSVDELSGLCYAFAKGGIDIIKDDHGLANQKYAPFDERVKACVKAKRRAEDATGQRSFYYPNITSMASETIDRYKKAADFGVDGVLICPHIAGVEVMHQLARLDMQIPIMAHPAFSGSLTTDAAKGLSPDFLYGQLWRALGADFSIYPNTGGRFSFSLEQCEKINKMARGEMDFLFKRTFPVPAGGLKIDEMEHWIETYGPDTVFLIGSNLYEHPAGIEEGSRELQKMLLETG